MGRETLPRDDGEGNRERVSVNWKGSRGPLCPDAFSFVARGPEPQQSPLGARAWRGLCFLPLLEHMPHDWGRIVRDERGFLKSIPSAQKDRKAMQPGGPALEEWGRLGHWLREVGMGIPSC